jgi:hypothetical protein
MTATVSAGTDGREGGYDAVSEWKHCGIGTSDDYDDNGGDSSVVGNAAKPNDRSKLLRRISSVNRQHSDRAALRTTAPRTTVDCPSSIKTAAGVVENRGGSDTPTHNR